MTDIVIWAQSVCRSTMALYREVKRQSGCPVTVIVRRSEHGKRRANCVRGRDRVRLRIQM